MCSFAQSTPVPVYAESFRQGSTRVIEERFEAKLTPQDPTYRERIKDPHWTDRYRFPLLLKDQKVTPRLPPGK